MLDSEQIDLKDVLAILRRQKRLLLLIITMVFGLAVVYFLMATPIYQSTVLLQVDGRNSNLLDPISAGQEQSAILNSRVDSEVEILRSQATALAVVLDADLMRDPEFGPQLGWLNKLGLALGTDFDGNALRRLVGLSPKSPPTQAALVNGTLRKLQTAVDIRRRGLTYLIAISVTSTSPQRAADIANTYAQTYISRQIAAKTQAAISARDVLRRQIVTAETDIADTERAMNAFIELNLARLEKESGDPAIADLRRRLNSAVETQARTTAQVLSAESARAARDWTGMASTLGDQALAELARQRTEAERRLGTAASGSADAIDVEAELARLDADLVRAASATLSSVREDIGTMRDRERDARTALRTQLLQSDLSAEMLAELFNLQQSATVARNQYQTLLARERDLGALANLQIADARIVSEALPPNSPSAPSARLILAVAVLGGLGIGVLVVFLKEYFIGGIVSASQLGNVMQARVPVSLTTLDSAKSGADPADAIISAPMSSYAESFRKLRAAIDIGLAGTNAPPETEKRGRIILICSALQAEGKTTTAIALARTYALSGANTLLIDGDLRRPSVASRMEINATTGLIDLLVPSEKTEALSVTTFADTQSPLVVICAGDRSHMPTDQLLNGASFRGLMEVVASQFDIVIIDSPPLLPVVDTRYLARYADALVHVVRYGSTTQGEVREASSQLREFLQKNATYLGILNQAERELSGYEYDENYSYYEK